MADEKDAPQKPSLDQQWREWGVRYAAQCFRGEDPEKAVRMAEALVRYARNGTGPIHCGFCGKSNVEVQKIIGGERAFICSECAPLVMERLKEASPPIPDSSPQGAHDVRSEG